MARRGIIENKFIPRNDSRRATLKRRANREWFINYYYSNDYCVVLLYISQALLLPVLPILMPHVTTWCVIMDTLQLIHSRLSGIAPSGPQTYPPVASLAECVTVVNFLPPSVIISLCHVLPHKLTFLFGKYNGVCHLIGNYYWFFAL